MLKPPWSSKARRSLPPRLPPSGHARPTAAHRAGLVPAARILARTHGAARTCAPPAGLGTRILDGADGHQSRAQLCAVSEKLWAAEDKAGSKQLVRSPVRLAPFVVLKATHLGRNIHVVSLVHALLIIPLALRCLGLESLSADPAFGWHPRSGTLTAVACGYFLWDTLESVVHFADIGFVVHGTSNS